MDGTNGRSGVPAFSRTATGCAVATSHTFAAGPDGGSLLVLFVPGGLEEMFIELSQLPPDSIRDPRVRAEISARHDSIPTPP